VFIRHHDFISSGIYTIAFSGAVRDRPASCRFVYNCKDCTATPLLPELPILAVLMPFPRFILMPSSGHRRVARRQGGPTLTWFETLSSSLGPSVGTIATSYGLLSPSPLIIHKKCRTSKSWFGIHAVNQTSPSPRPMGHGRMAGGPGYRLQDNVATSFEKYRLDWDRWLSYQGHHYGQEDCGTQWSKCRSASGSF
jgi:hypothetical protein